MRRSLRDRIKRKQERPYRKPIPREVRKRRNARIEELARQGLAVKEIVVAVAVSQMTIYRVLRAAEIEPVKKYPPGRKRCRST